MEADDSNEYCAMKSAATEGLHVDVHAVTMSFPSPSVSCVEDAPQEDTHLSCVNDPGESACQNSSSSTEPQPTVTLQKVHIVRNLLPFIHKHESYSIFFLFH